MVDLADLPPSAKLVAKVLEYEAPLTYEELQTETQLPESTLKDALDQLRDLDHVVRQYHSPDGPRDGRSHVYIIAE